MALELVKCPQCGYMFQMDVKARINDGKTKVVRGLLDSKKSALIHIETIDIECPNCKRTFEYKVKS